MMALPPEGGWYGVEAPPGRENQGTAMRIIREIALLASLTAFASTAAADPITDVLSGSDNNFTFSVIHTSSSGSDGQSGSITHDVSLNTSLALPNDWDATPHFHLDLTARSGGAVSIYHVAGAFDLTDLSDGVYSGNQLVGYLTFNVLSGDDFLDGETFYFEDNTYSSAVNKPNSQSGNLVTLWGATNYDHNLGTPVIGNEIDLMAGGAGIDLRLQLADPVPEPGTFALFGLAGLGFAVYRRRRKTA